MPSLAELRARIEAHKAALQRIRAEEARGDPVAFARLCGITPDPWQVTVLRSNARRMILNTTRQAGKSTTTAVKALHGAIYEPKSLTLLVSPSLRQSAELFKKVSDDLARVPGAPVKTEDNKLSFTLSNGSRVISLPSNPDTIRGFSPTRVFADEAAFISDELFTAVDPMLAVTQGQLILMSTPFGRRGYFFKAWEHGGQHWERHAITAHDIPRIPKDWLEMQRQTLGDARFRQEFLCEFLSAATGLVYAGFDHDRNTIQALPAGGAPWNHVCGMDFGIVDDCSFNVCAWRENDPSVYIVESFKRKDILPSDAADEWKALDATYRFVKTVGDLGGLGKVFGEEMRRRFGVPVEPAEKQNKRGAISLMNDGLSRGLVKVVAPKTKDLTDEWVNLIWDEKREKEAPGFPNHCSDGALYAWRACPSYHERMPGEGPPKGSKEALEKEAAEMLEKDLEELEGEGQTGKWYRGGKR